MSSVPLCVPSTGVDCDAALTRQSRLSVALRAILPLFLLYVLYTLVRFLVAESAPAEGMANAIRVIALERRLRLDWEGWVQASVLAHPLVIRAANWYYVAGFLPVLIGSGLLAAIRAPEVFYRWRRVFAASLFLALVGFGLFPLAPPRLLPSEYGYADTLLRYGPHYYGNAAGSSLFNAYGSIPSLVNLYAAMPSMHVAWSMIAGILFAAAFHRRGWAMALGAVHPAIMAFAVVVTGNHYILDVLAGLLVLAAATMLAAVSRRLVPPRSEMRS